jgi:hypothetical protein
MAHGVYFVCRGCGREICAWDEGNPYYLDEFGRKRYAYHRIKSATAAQETTPGTSV